MLFLKAELLTKSLKAAAVCMPKTDVRYYLNGINIHENHFDLTLQATDGHRVTRLALHTDATSVDNKPELLASVTVAHCQLATIQAVLKINSHKMVAFKVTDFGALQIVDNSGSILLDNIKCLDGKYPDVDRVLKPIALLDSAELESLSFSPAYLADLGKVYTTMLDSKKDMASPTIYTVKGEKLQAVYVGSAYTLEHVIMPRRK